MAKDWAVTSEKLRPGETQYVLGQRRKGGLEARNPKDVNTLLWSMDRTPKTEGRAWRL